MHRNETYNFNEQSGSAGTLSFKLTVGGFDRRVTYVMPAGKELLNKKLKL